MNKATVKLQIPLNKSLRDRVEKHARKMGFSSLQDFTRVLFTNVVQDDLRFSLVGAPEELSPEASVRLDRLTREALGDYKAGKLKSFDNVEGFLSNLKNETDRTDQTIR